MLKKWFKNKEDKKAPQQLKAPNIPGIMPAHSIDKLLGVHSGRLTHINELSGLSKDNFNRFYLSAISQYARFVQQLPASEVHHHAGAGGMLTHALEVCVIALKVRRSYLLSDTGEAEEISKTQDLWTYAVFTGALCHDLAKVAVDQVLTVYDEKHNPQTWQPWNKFIDEQGQWYTSEFVRGRQHRLHEKASPLLIHKIIPAHGMKWIGSDLGVFAAWLACISGDMDNASSIGEIVGIADGKSVASNLGAGNGRMPSVRTKPLHEKMLTALRHLLMEGELPLNRNGAAGWTKGDDCWLVSKLTVDAIREQLTHEGHSGVPAKNGRIFDILQEHAVITPYGDKAIWSATVKGDGWSNDLTLIKLAANKIWVNPEQRPDDFEGRIIVSETKDNKSHSEAKLIKPAEVAKDDLSSIQAVNIKEEAKIEKTNPLKKVAYTELEPLEQDTSSVSEEDDDLLAFLPSLSPESEYSDVEKVITDQPDRQKEIEPQIKAAAAIIEKQIDAIDKPNAPLIITESVKNIDGQQGQVSLFFSWLQEGIRAGSLKTNQAKARIHRVNEGVILITPGIFQDFVKRQANENIKWTAVQQKVLKKNWHVRDGKGLNVVKYQVKGQNKQTTVNAILFKDTAKVFGEERPLPDSSPHLIKID